jgi:hypothetical protein
MMYEKEMEEYNKVQDIDARIEEEIEQWRKQRNQRSSGTESPLSSAEEEEDVDINDSNIED